MTIRHVFSGLARGEERKVGVKDIPFVRSILEFDRNLLRYQRNLLLFLVYLVDC